jgi:subfamily B ATP-binding cassette protein MsbA
MLVKLKPYRKSLFSVVVLQLLAAVFIATQPLYFQKLIESAFNAPLHANWPALITPVLVLVSLFCAVSTTQMITGYIGSRLSANVMRDLQMSFLSHASHLPLSYFRNEKNGELLTRFNHDIGLVQNLLAGLGPMLLKDSLTCTLLIVLLFLISPLSLVVATLLLITFSFLFSYWINKKLLIFAKKQRRQWSSINQSFSEMIYGIETIKAYCSQNRAQSHFKHKTDDFHTLSLQYGRFTALYSPLSDLLIRAGGLLPLILAYYLLSSKALMLTTFITYFFCVNLLMASIASITNAINGLQPMWVAVQNMSYYFNQPIEQSKNETNPNSIGKVACIAFKNISYRYPSKVKGEQGTTAEYAIDGFSAEYKIGDINQIFGANGTGKTTLIDILLGYIVADKGEVYINGVQQNQQQLCKLREKIALVSSGQYLFEGTVRDNLLLANPNENEQEMKNALDSVGFNLHSKRHENELDIQLFNDASNLSDGERQKLVLARAFLSQKIIMIFDEPLVFLDKESKEKVMKVMISQSYRSVIVFLNHEYINTDPKYNTTD